MKKIDNLDETTSLNKITYDNFQRENTNHYVLDMVTLLIIGMIIAILDRRRKNFIEINVISNETDMSMIFVSLLLYTMHNLKE